MSESYIRSLGLKVVVAASNDENHPPENMIDGNANTFWMSTGMFPQEFIIRFAEMTNVSSVTLDSYNGMVVNGCLSTCALRLASNQFRVYPAYVVIWDRLHDTRYPRENKADRKMDGWESDVTCMRVIPSQNQVKHLKVEKNTSENASHFEFVEEKELKLTEGQLQTNSISLGGSNATHLRFIITSGYDHFVAVHKIGVNVHLT